MPLLQIKDRIINTEHVTTAKYTDYTSSSSSFLVIAYINPSGTKIPETLMFKGKEADALWKKLSSLSEIIQVPF